MEELMMDKKKRFKIALYIFGITAGVISGIASLNSRKKEDK